MTAEPLLSIIMYIVIMYILLSVTSKPIQHNQTRNHIPLSPTFVYNMRFSYGKIPAHYLN